MLDTLRRGATGWVAKILLTVLVLSFAIWGVADMFRSIGHSYLAKVGSATITPDQFQTEFREQLNAISAQVGRRITADQARQFGIDSRVLTQLIGKTAIDQHAGDLGLTLSESTLKQSIERDPTFKGVNGKFDKAQFDGILHQIGLSERGYLAIRRHEDLREMLTSALVNATVVPQPLVDIINAHREEMRTVEHLTMDPAKAAPVSAPDEATLKAAYEASKGRYMTPAYRKLGVLVMSLDTLKKRMQVTDEEIKAAYEADPDHYNTPERRHVLQVAFKDKAAAEAAKAALKSGKSWAEVVKEAGAKDTDVDLGVLTKKQIIDPKIAAAAFALPKDAVSDVVEGRFATVLLKVTEIQAGTTKTLADVKEQVKDRLATEKAKTEIQKIHDQVDDNRAAQKSLKDIGQTFNIPFYEVPATDRDNHAPDGKTALDVPDAGGIIAAGFEAQPGVERDAVEMPDGGFTWVDLQGIIEPKQKPFEEVKAAVETAWMEAEKRKALTELATKLVERINKGETLSQIANEVGGKPDTAIAITRKTLPQGLTQGAVGQAFALPKGGAGSAETADGKSRILFKVVDIKPAPPPTKDQAERITKEIRSQDEGDTLAAYVAALQTRLGVSVDETVLRRTLGTDRQ